MVYTSNVRNVTGVNSLFLGDTYHHLWEAAANRFRTSPRLRKRLNDHQLNIAADVALRTIALERYSPEMFFTPAVNPAMWLYNSLRIVAERKELFPPDHDYRRIDLAFNRPSQVEEELTEMLSLAGHTVYEWETQYGRFPHYRENPDFLLEYKPVSPTSSFIYNRFGDLPASPFI